MAVLATITLTAGVAIVVLDAIGARAARRLRISYGWMMPVSLAFYAGLGLVVTSLATVIHATVVAALVAVADVTLGTEMAYRAGVLQWPTGRPTPAQWVLTGLSAIILMSSAAFFAGLVVTLGAP